MNRKVAVFVVRSIGTLAGVFGAMMLYSAVCMAFALPKADVSIIFFLIFACVNFVIGLFCFWIAYLVWFRFSPRAIQQTCGLLGFILIGFVMTFFPATNQENACSRSLIYLGTIVFALFGYRLLSRYLNSVIFVDQGSASTSPTSS
jgi:hypothetical protein